MSTKKITDRERFIAFSITATKEQLVAAVEQLRTAQKTRFPEPKRRKKPADEAPPKAAGAGGE